MCISSLMVKSECDEYSVLLTNIQCQVTFGKVRSMVYMLHYAIVLAKEYSILKQTST